MKYTNTLYNLLKNESNIFMFLVSLIFSVVLNLPQYLVYYEKDYFFIIKSFILSFMMVYFLFILLGCVRIIFSFLFLLFSLIGAVSVYFIVNYKIIISKNTVAVLFETSYDEATGLISGYLIGWVIFILILSIITIFLFNRKRINTRKFIIFLPFLIILFPIIYFAGSPTYYFFRFMPLPYNIFQSMYGYVKEASILKELRREKKIDFTITNINNENLKVVLIIGEAARSDHFQLNGYLRETNPNLVKEKKLVSFKNVLSCGTITRIAVPCLITNATLDNPQDSLRSISLIDVFKKAGFYTAWISNQGFLGSTETPVSMIAKDANETLFLNKTGDFGRLQVIDENLLKPIKEILYENNNKRLFIVVHTIGSHWRYDSHYPESFRVFVPTCTKNTQKFCENEELVNSYDNSILYTDYFISEVINIFRKENSLIMYVSDHGESLGEKGLYSHWEDNMDAIEQRITPLIIWFSDLYKSKYSEKYRNVLKNSRIWNKSLRDEEILKENKSLNHDWVFHTIIDCASISTSLLNYKFSLCR